MMIHTKTVSTCLQSMSMKLKKLPVLSSSPTLSSSSTARAPTCYHNSTPRQVRLFASAISLEGSISITKNDANNISSSASEMQSKFVLILGKPGGGKGTISTKILNDFPMFKHLSTGDLLRQHVRDGTSIGLKAKKHMDNGDLVPDEVMIELVLNDASNVNDGDSLLLDGFPRTMEQAIALDKSLEVDLVINLDVPVDTIVKRISDRWIHPGSGRIYNYSYNAPKTRGKDDVTNEDLIQREDDKPETVRKRLEAYDTVTAPLINYYSEKGILKSFEGTKSDVIYVEVQKWLDEHFSVYCMDD